MGIHGGNRVVKKLLNYGCKPVKLLVLIVPGKEEIVRLSHLVLRARYTVRRD